ncbi:pyocin knob domain-containing protein [Lactococcus lactis]|uniref:pyocin knob domain-containing protein n=1 Tax=Lactococcus lactis TaxID=1358 RepID=UPI00223BAD80|nr:pyocin knob domain-containing protein [Lactococcus lactis]
MSYEKQTWNKYDELKTEEENIENGAVVTDNRMNHMESGIGDNDANLASHLADKNNPHKVTAAQVGLGNVQNFGLATEDEAKQGISNAKYMTPSLTQAVLSANINSIAYANSADGTDGFTTVYPNLNLLEDGKFAKPISSNWYTDGTTISKDDITGYFKVKFNGTGSLNRTYYGESISTIPIGQKYSVYIKAYSLESSLNIKMGSVNSSQSVTVTNNSNIPKTYKVEGLVRGASNTFGIFGGLTTTLGTLFISEIKLELGSIATPWMPSASEVTTADWPNYVGFSNTVKTNKSASDYTWFPVKDSELTNKVDSHVNNKANPHAVTASQVGAYSKTESDSKLTDLSDKAILNKGNIASGTDLNSVTGTGFYRIGGLLGGTDVLNVPSELSGLNFYAFLKVTGELQELTVYSPKQDTTWTYSRSVSGSSATWSSWSKTVMADDSGKVTVTRIETTSDVRTWTPITLSNVSSAVLMYQIINGVIHLNGQGNWGSFTANQSKTVATLPAELRPTRTVNKVITTQNTNNNDKPMEIQIQEGGNINIWSMPASTSGRYGGFEESYPLG